MQDLDQGTDVIESLSIATPSGHILCSSEPDVVGEEPRREHPGVAERSGVDDGDVLGRRAEPGPDAATVA